MFSLINDTIDNLNEFLSKNDLLSKIVITLILIVVSIIFFQIGKVVIKHFIKKNIILKNILNEGKIETISTLSISLLLFLSLTFGIISLIYTWFGPVSLGLATIIGVAIGASLQGLIKDIISGLLIIIEDQFKIGDYIKIDNIEGTVTKLTLRSTQFKDPNGSFHTVPNSSIVKVTNFSKGPVRILVEVIISNKNNIRNVLDTLNKFCYEYKNDDLASKPIVRFSSIKEFSMTVKIIAFSDLKKSYEIENDIRTELKELLDENNIEFVSKLDIEKSEARDSF